MSLFIGGSRDGKRIKLEREMPDVRFPVYHKMSVLDARRWADDPLQPTSMTRDIEVYVRKPWSNGDIIRHVYFHESIREEETLDRMINGYRDPDQESIKEELARCKAELKHYRTMFGADRP